MHSGSEAPQGPMGVLSDAKRTRKPLLQRLFNRWHTARQEPAIAGARSNGDASRVGRTIPLSPPQDIMQQQGQQKQQQAGQLQSGQQTGSHHVRLSITPPQTSCPLHPATTHATIEPTPMGSISPAVPDHNSSWVASSLTLGSSGSSGGSSSTCSSPAHHPLITLGSGNPMPEALLQHDNPSSAARETWSAAPAQPVSAGLATHTVPSSVAAAPPVFDTDNLYLYTVGPAGAHTSLVSLCSGAARMTPDYSGGIGSWGSDLTYSSPVNARSAREPFDTLEEGACEGSEQQEDLEAHNAQLLSRLSLAAATVDPVAAGSHMSATAYQPSAPFCAPISGPTDRQSCASSATAFMDAMLASSICISPAGSPPPSPSPPLSRPRAQSAHMAVPVPADTPTADTVHYHPFRQQRSTAAPPFSRPAACRALSAGQHESEGPADCEVFATVPMAAPRGALFAPGPLVAAGAWCPSAAPGLDLGRALHEAGAWPPSAPLLPGQLQAGGCAGAAGRASDSQLRAIQLPACFPVAGGHGVRKAMTAECATVEQPDPTEELLSSLPSINTSRHMSDARRRRTAPWRLLNPEPLQPAGIRTAVAGAGVAVAAVAGAAVVGVALGGGSMETPRAAAAAGGPASVFAPRHAAAAAFQPHGRSYRRTYASDTFLTCGVLPEEGDGPLLWDSSADRTPPSMPLTNSTVGCPASACDDQGLGADAAGCMGACDADMAAAAGAALQRMEVDELACMLQLGADARSPPSTPRVDEWSMLSSSAYFRPSPTRTHADMDPDLATPLYDPDATRAADAFSGAAYRASSGNPAAQVARTGNAACQMAMLQAAAAGPTTLPRGYASEFMHRGQMRDGHITVLSRTAPRLHMCPPGFPRQSGRV